MTCFVKTKLTDIIQFQNDILILNISRSEKMHVGDQVIVWFSCNVRDGNNGNGLFGYGRIIDIKPLTIRFTYHIGENEQVLTQNDDVFIEARNNQTNWRENKIPISNPVIQEFAEKALYFCPSRWVAISDELTDWLISFFS